MSHFYEHYHSSTRRDGREIKREERLPSIQHMVGDSFKRKSSPYDFKDVKHSLPHVSRDTYPHHAPYVEHEFGQRGPTLAPIHSGHSTSHRSYSSYPNQIHSSTSRSHHVENHHSRPHYNDIPAESSSARMGYPESSHGVFQAFYSARSGDLVNVATGYSPQGILRSSELPDEGDYDPRKKYKCSDCGKRFDRPSGLDQHRPKHTGERAFSCPVSGCDSTFTVRSNMTRHVRSQHKHDVVIADHYDGFSPYSSAAHGSYGRSSPPSSSYYSSSRLK